jgi:hypothetical protein
VQAPPSAIVNAAIATTLVHICTVEAAIATFAPRQYMSP